MRGVTTKLAVLALALPLAIAFALASIAPPPVRADAPVDRPARHVLQSGETFATDTTITANEVVVPAGARVRVEGGVALRVDCGRLVVDDDVQVDGSGLPGTSGADGRDAGEWTSSGAGNCAAMKVIGKVARVHRNWEDAGSRPDDHGGDGGTGGAGGRGATIEVRCDEVAGPGGVADLAGRLAVTVRGGRGGDGGRAGGGRVLVCGSCGARKRGTHGQRGPKGPDGADGSFTLAAGGRRVDLDLEGVRVREQRTMRAAFAAHTDSNGMVEPDRNPGHNIGAGNGLLYTSEMYIFLAYRGYATDDDRAAFVRLVRSLEAEPGLVNRNPPRGPHEDQQGPDDYVGLVAAAGVLGGDASAIAREVLDYGRRHAFVFNNVNPGTALKPGTIEPQWSPMLFRFPGFVAHVHWAAGAAPPEAWATAWAVKMAVSRGRGEASGRILEWLMLQVLPANAPGRCLDAARLWRENFQEDYPGGISELMAEYFAVHFGREHPLAKYAVERRRGE